MVINDIGEYRGREKIWKCKCECNNIVYYTTSELNKYIGCNEDSIECEEDNNKV